MLNRRIVALGREADRRALAAEVALQEAVEALQRLQTAVEAGTEALKAFRNAVLGGVNERRGR